MRSLFHKDFTLMIIGQIISIFGNSILRFSLSLYVLDLSGSASIFASILAISMIPTILLSPFGGMIADRLPRKSIMVVLDFTTSFCILLFFLLRESDAILILIGCFMVLLSIIQAFYQPAVQASIPSITQPDQLVAANGITTSINAIANLAGPILGGLCYGFFGISWILSISATCFFSSALLELFLHIPFEKQPSSVSLRKMVTLDFKEAYQFVVLDRPIIFKLLLVLCGLNLLLTAMLQVALPYIIKIQLGLSSQLYGFIESSMAIGMIIGAFIAMSLKDRIHIQTSYLPLWMGALAMVPMGLAILTFAYPLPSYTIIFLSTLSGTSFIAIFNIVVQSYLQLQTPAHLLGKISSFITTIVLCATPIGQAIYGFCFDAIPMHSAWIVLFACASAFLLALYAKTILKRIPAI